MVRLVLMISCSFFDIMEDLVIRLTLKDDTKPKLSTENIVDIIEHTMSHWGISVIQHGGCLDMANSLIDESTFVSELVEEHEKKKMATSSQT